MTRKYSLSWLENFLEEAYNSLGGEMDASELKEYNIVHELAHFKFKKHDKPFGMKWIRYYLTTRSRLTGKRDMELR
jgi:hypothetical protein